MPELPDPRTGPLRTSEQEDLPPEIRDLLGKAHKAHKARNSSQESLLIAESNYREAERRYTNLRSEFNTLQADRDRERLIKEQLLSATGIQSEEIPEHPEAIKAVVPLLWERVERRLMSRATLAPVASSAPAGAVLKYALHQSRSELQAGLSFRQLVPQIPSWVTPEDMTKIQFLNQPGSVKCYHRNNHGEITCWVFAYYD